MEIENKTIGFAVCGSFCTFKTVFEEIKKLKNNLKLTVDMLPQSVI